jgi:hypothetical protein
MDFLFTFWVLGIIFLLVEKWYLAHLYTQESYFSSGYTYEKIGFKRFHLVLLVFLNMIPIANAIGIFLILLIPAVETNIKLKLVSPNEEDKEPSKLDEWLNKTL